MTALVDVLLHAGAVAHAHPHTAGHVADFAIAMALLAGLALVTFVTLSRPVRVRDP